MFTLLAISMCVKVHACMCAGIHKVPPCVLRDQSKEMITRHMQCVHGPFKLILTNHLCTLSLGTVYTCDVLPADETASQRLGEAWQVSKSHPTQSRGRNVCWSGSKQ